MKTCGHRAANAELRAGNQHWSSSTGTGEEASHPPAERGRERGGGFGYRAEDEDAVGRGRCSRVCREVKTSSGNDCDPGPKMHSRAPLELIVLWIHHSTRGPVFWGSSKWRGATSEVFHHCHRRWQISPLWAKIIILRLVMCKVMLHLCTVNMSFLFHVFSFFHYCQQCWFASPL